jgi:hypothetical protein
LSIVSASRQPQTLTASEIGEFAFCPQAWYLHRRGAPRSAAGTRALADGTRRHRELGRTADALAWVARLRVAVGWLLGVVLLLVVLLWLAELVVGSGAWSR